PGSGHLDLRIEEAPQAGQKVGLARRGERAVGDQEVVGPELGGVVAYVVGQRAPADLLLTLDEEAEVDGRPVRGQPVLGGLHAGHDLTLVVVSAPSVDEAV